MLALCLQPLAERVISHCFLLKLTRCLCICHGQQVASVCGGHREGGSGAKFPFVTSQGEKGC